jgi:carbon starvation protein
LLVSIWLKKQGRNFMPTFIPMVFVLVMTVWAMGKQVIFEWSGAGAADTNVLLFIFGAMILGFALWIIVEAFQVLSKKQDPSDMDKTA